MHSWDVTASAAQRNYADSNPRVNKIKPKAEQRQSAGSRLMRKKALQRVVKYALTQLFFILTQSQARREYRCRNKRGKSKDIYCQLPAGSWRERWATGTSCHESPALFWCRNGVWAKGKRHVSQLRVLLNSSNQPGWERSMWRYGMRHRRSCNWQFYLEKCNPTAFRYCWYFWHPSSVLGFQSLLGDVKQNYFCIHFTFRITAVKPRMYEHCLFFTEAAS